MLVLILHLLLPVARVPEPVMTLYMTQWRNRPKLLEDRFLVSYNRCGVRSDLMDRFCRACGAKLDRPPISGRFKVAKKNILNSLKRSLRQVVEVNQVHVLEQSGLNAAFERKKTLKKELNGLE